MANKFNKGDLVRIKSGGPVMTVDKCRGDPLGYHDFWKEYRCVWFKSNAEQNGTFGEHLLELAET